MARLHCYGAIATVCLAYAVLPGCGGTAPTAPGGATNAGGQPGVNDPQQAAKDIQPVKVIKLGGDAWVSFVGVSPDGKRVFGGLGDVDDKFQLWEVDSPKLIYSKGSTENGGTAVSPAGDFAAFPLGETGGPIVLLDMKTGKEVRELGRKSGLFAYSPRLRFSASGGVVAVNNKTRLIGLDTQTGQARFVCDNEAELFGLSGFFDNDRKIASSGPSGVVKVWDITTGKQVATLSNAGPGDIGELEISSDGKLLATGGWGQPIKIWDTATWKKIREISPWAGNYGSMVFLPNRNILAHTAQTADAVNLVDVTTGEIKHTLRGHKSSVIAMAVTPDGSTLVTAGRADRLINFWDLKQLP